MDLYLDLFLAKCDIDYDDIWFYSEAYQYDKPVYSYNEMIESFDLSTLKVLSFRFDPLSSFVIVFK